MIQYTETEVLLYDPLAANRAATRTSLLALGFRRIDSCASLIGLTNSLVRNPPHLLICDCQREDHRLFSFIQELRQGSTLHNPFLAIILVSWDKCAGLVRSAVDSGADDFLLRPVSPDMLAPRIAAIVQSRKPFVISSGYVGPDRRFRRDRSDPELFSPPNVLKSIVERRSGDCAGATLLDREIAAARRVLDLRKLRADVLRFGAHLRQWQEQSWHPSARSESFDRMQGMASAILKRAERLEDEVLTTHCARLVSDLMGLTESGQKQASTLQKAAGDLYVLLTAGCSLERFEREVDIYQESIEARESPWVMLAV